MLDVRIAGFQIAASWGSPNRATGMDMYEGCRAGATDLEMTDGGSRRAGLLAGLKGGLKREAK